MRPELLAETGDDRLKLERNLLRAEAPRQLAIADRPCRLPLEDRSPPAAVGRDPVPHVTSASSRVGLRSRNPPGPTGAAAM